MMTWTIRVHFHWYTLAVLALTCSDVRLTAQRTEALIPGLGPDSQTLVLHASRRSPYALYDGVDLLQWQLSRVATQIRAVSISEITAESLQAADYVVIFCPQPDPELSPVLVQWLQAAATPVLWIGFVPPRLSRLEPYLEQFTVTDPTASLQVTNVWYRGQEIRLEPVPFMRVAKPTNSIASVLVSVPPSELSTTPQPIAWMSGSTTFFAGLPNTFAAAGLLADLLLGFYAVEDVPPNRLFLMLRDYHPSSDHESMMRKADLLYDRNIPFAVSVTPAWHDPESGKEENLETNPEFLQALHYVQSRGGRLILSGLSRRPSEPLEFWDADLDRAVWPGDAESVRLRLGETIERFVGHGLYPLAWETPGHAAPSTLRSLIEEFFSTSVGRLPLSDATRLDTYVAPSLFAVTSSHWMIPQNTGFIPLAQTNDWSQVKERAAFLLALRGNVIGVEVHAYLPFARFAFFVAWLESLRTPFLEIATLDLWTQWPGGLLLTGRASRNLPTPSGSIFWKALDGSSQVINEFEEPNVVAQKRLFRNRGAGLIEYYRLREETP